MPVKVAELVHLRSARPWKMAPSEISLGVSDAHGRRCRVVEPAPLLPVQVIFLPFISLGKKYSRDHQLLSSALICTHCGLYSLESVSNINQKNPFFSPLCSTQVPKEIETMVGRAENWAAVVEGTKMKWKVCIAMGSCTY